jgi:hypothetical protein
MSPLLWLQSYPARPLFPSTRAQRKAARNTATGLVKSLGSLLYFAAQL